MAINLTKLGVAVGVGILDEFLEGQDNSANRAGFKRWSAMARVGVPLLGYLAPMVGLSRYAGIGETAAVAYTPLLVKTLASEFHIMGTKSQAFAARNIGAQARNWVPSGLSGGGYRPTS